VAPFVAIVGGVAAYGLGVLASGAFHTTRSGRLKQRAMAFERCYSMGDSSGPPLKLHVLGDSFPMGYGADSVAGSIPYYVAALLAERGHRVHVENRSVSGAYLRDVVGHIDSLEPGPDDIVLVFVGGMDTTHLTPLHEYGEHLDRLLERLEKLPCRQALVAGSPDMSRNPAFPWFLKRLFAASCRRENALVRSRLHGSGITHVDICGDGKLRRAHYSADGDHPNDSGYRVWADLFTARIRP
jgi:acyl-CoA thioesterase-1